MPEQQQQQGAEAEPKWAKEDAAGFREIELGHGAEVKDEREQFREALPPPPTQQAREATPPWVLERSFGGSSRKVRLFEWNVQDYTIKIRRKRHFTILRNIVGRADAGTLSAVIGPSGCGKTSLLDCLALRNQAFTGNLRLDGQPLTGEFFLNTGYVHQRELFFSNLTVREHLLFHAVNRMSRIRSMEECQARVEAVMDEVDLTRVADNRIGGGEMYVTKGLSGGERKRLNIATELLADPSILLLDEPTSGLDSVMGELICLLLKALAVRQPKRVVITAVHSPPSRLFMLFTHVMLLSSDGRLAYWGPRDQLLHFLESLGYVCPPQFNPADFALELASTKKIQGFLHENSDAPTIATSSTRSLAGAPDVAAMADSLPPEDVDIAHLVLSDSSSRLVEACKEHVIDQYFDPTHLVPNTKHREVMGVKGTKSSPMVLFRMNLWRAWLQESRERAGLAVRLAMNVLLGLIFGLLYFRQIPKDNGRNTAGFLFSLLVTLLIASSIQVCLHFPYDYASLMREYYSGANTPGPYFVGRTMASIPQSLLFLLLGIIPYFMTGLSSDPVAFWYFVLILFLLNFAAQSLGYLASSFTANPIVGLSILPLIITPMILFSGMLYERRSVPPGLQWIQDISVMNYSFALLVLNQIQKVGDQVESFLQTFLHIHQDQFHSFLVDLVLLAIGYRIIAMLILMIRVHFISKPR